MSTAT